MRQPPRLGPRTVECTATAQYSPDRGPRRTSSCSCSRVTGWRSTAGRDDIAPPRAARCQGSGRDPQHVIARVFLSSFLLGLLLTATLAASIDRRGGPSVRAKGASLAHGRSVAARHGAGRTHRVDGPCELVAGEPPDALETRTGNSIGIGLED